LVGAYFGRSKPVAAIAEPIKAAVVEEAVVENPFSAKNMGGCKKPKAGEEKKPCDGKKKDL